MPSIPEQYLGSAALQFIMSRGWNWRQANAPNIELEKCPYCDKGGFGHLYMEIHGSIDEQKNRDGLHQCHRCGKGGNLNSLKEHLGVTVSGVHASAEKKVDPPLDVEAAHLALLEDEGAMDYLMNGRGFSREIICQQKIGFTPKKFFRECGEVRAIIYPYLVNDNCVFWHYRTLPTMPLSESKVVKAFASPNGWDAPLYNGGILREGMTEIVFVEGEANCIAAMDHGITDICGVPGANFKKAEWITTLDTMEGLKIYVCYDRDKVGQKAAQTLASRIGVEKCWKIMLPEFTFTDPETGKEKKGKDLNEWFVHGGGTKEAFDKLKEEAVMFDVDGVSSEADAVDELRELFEDKGVEPKYKTGWLKLNTHVGFDEGDVIDILAPEKVGKTTFGLNLMEHMVNAYDEDGVIICLEMTRVKLARKWVSHVTGVADNIPKTPEEAEALKAEFLKSIPLAQYKAANRQGTLYFCYPRYSTTEEIYTLIRDCIRRYGVKWVMLDNLQRFADTTPRGSRNRSEHLSEISKKLSQIAKDYTVQIIRILQPHRLSPGEIASSDNTDGSSQVAKDCDASISLHRNRVGQLTVSDWQSMPCIEQDATFDEKTLVKIDLSRYSAGGAVTFHCDGARSTFTEYNIAQLAVIKAEAEAKQDVGYKAINEKLNLPSATIPGDEKLNAPAPGEITI